MFASTWHSEVNTVWPVRVDLYLDNLADLEPGDIQDANQRLYPGGIRRVAGTPHVQGHSDPEPVVDSHPRLPYLRNGRFGTLTFSKDTLVWVILATDDAKYDQQRHKHQHQDADDQQDYKNGNG